MIGYLKGKIQSINNDSIILNVNDVGYLVLTPRSYEYKIDQVEEFYVYTHVREDQITLFGFKDNTIKLLFLKLISVKGVGPKTALGILASVDYQNLLVAIENNDINFLKKMPGIGLKSASQIVLDLKGKVIISNDSVNSELNDAIEALKSLGYKDADIKKVEKQLASEQLSIEQYIKKGLQLLLK